LLRKARISTVMSRSAFTNQDPSETAPRCSGMSWPPTQRSFSDSPGHEVKASRFYGHMKTWKELPRKAPQPSSPPQKCGLVQQNGGPLNGSTRFDFTNYFEILPSNKLETALWAEADRMNGLAVTEENLKNQQGVVGNEVKVNVINRPYGAFPWLADARSTQTRTGTTRTISTAT